MRQKPLTNELSQVKGFARVANRNSNTRASEKEKNMLFYVCKLSYFHLTFLFFLPSIVFLHVAKNAIPFFAEIDRILNYSAQLTGANFIRKFKICSLNELNYIHSHFCAFHPFLVTEKMIGFHATKLE